MAAAAEGHVSGYGSKGYRSYVLTALMGVYVLNFIDRGLLAVVAPQLKPELGISDTSFGLLTGFGFAVLYTLVGIPLGQLAETRNRVTIMAVCVALWSVATALCGAARPLVVGGVTVSAFLVLLACRVGVGIGEAGCTPPANSLISDYYPPHRRSTALGYYAMGVTMGTVLANLIGGPVTDAFGWRAAFVVVGLPGLAIALLLTLTVKEPPRGYTDPPGTAVRETARFADAMAEIARRPSFWIVAFGSMFSAFCSYGLNSFQSLFVTRSFGLSTGEAAVLINVPVGIASSVGTLACGWLAERLGAKRPNAIAWLPGVGLLLSVPVYAWAFTTGNLVVCCVTLSLAGLLKYSYLAGQYTIGQQVVSARTRAVATAVNLFVVNLLGYGFGPLFIGAISDALFHAQMAGFGFGDVARKACEAKAVAGALKDACAAANPRSLRLAMLVTSALHGVAGLLFLASCRWLQRDMAAARR
jgi:MFS family permease